MRVIYFHQHFRLPFQPGGTRSYELAQQLLIRGHSVCMVCGESPQLNLPPTSKKGINRGSIDGIDIIEIALPYSNEDGIYKRTWTFINFAFIGLRIALTENYDLLYATSTPLTAGIPGIISKWIRKKKFIFEVRDLWPQLPRALGMKNPFLLWSMSILEWLSYHSADACVGLSPGICDGISKRSQKGKKIIMIPNGCDLDIFLPSERENLDLVGIKPTDIVAIFTGTHGIANGLDAVLDAAMELNKLKRKDIILAFIGEGKLKPHLIQRAKNEGLDNCRFYDPIPKIELNKVVASSDIGLMALANIPAFYYGTSPNKFFDYISSGLPVLNNYQGWLADMIKENKCGIVVPAQNAKAFAEGLIELADNPVRRKEYGQNARTLAENSFARKDLANRFVDFIEELTS